MGRRQRWPVRACGWRTADLLTSKGSGPASRNLQAVGLAFGGARFEAGLPQLIIVFGKVRRYEHATYGPTAMRSPDQASAAQMS
jgi:hypothetical protein